jgi:protein-disulfide isomerase
MNFNKFAASCLFTALLLSSAQAMAMPESGMEKKVEWKVQQTWPIAGKPLSTVHSLDGKYLYMLNDKQQVQIYTTQGQLHGTIPVDSGVTQIDISPQGEFLYLIDTAAKTFTAVAVSFIADIDTTGAPFKGPADAPVTLALFTDFECPYCKQIIPLLDEVLAKNPQKVKLAFKNMPLKFHKMAEPAAKAALAAHEQGKFWPLHDKLFAESKLSEEGIKKIAASLGLDMTRFEKDMASPSIQAKLQKDLIDAQSSGVTGTPTVFVNGRTPKQRTVEGFQAIIDEELEKLGKK